jgi:uncharacterized membrane protein
MNGMIGWRRPELIFVMTLVLVCVGLLWLPTGYENRRPEYSRLVKGRVIRVDNSGIVQTGIVKNGDQTLMVEVLTKPFRGEVVEAFNPLLGKMELDEVYREGQLVLLELTVAKGEIRGAHPRGTYRLRVELMLVLLFALLLMVVAGWTGVKALLSFVFAALMIWKVMIPAFLDGYDPVLVALGVVAALTAAISFLVGGVTRKGLVCFLGAFLGLALTSVLAQLFMKGFKLHGATRAFSETLLYSGFYYLDLGRIFVAGVFTASSGAVMDLAMDISASMHEVREKHPAITRREHFLSGMAVGRSVIGTMTTTLLLAYSGGFTTTLMVFMGQGMPIANILNINYIAAEVLNTLVGSFGLVTVAPFTALVGALIYGRARPRKMAAD